MPDVLSDLGLREVHVKINDLKRQIAELSAVYTPDYGKLKRAQADMVQLQETFNQDRSTILDRIKNDYQEAARRESLLAEAYGTQNAEVSGQGEKLIQYNILKREADSNRQLYDSMLQQLKESTIASAMRASNVRVVDAATPPLRPYKPDLPHSALIGLLGGLFLGAAFIIMRDRADVTIQQPAQAPSFSHVPELGIIPSSKAEASTALPITANTTRAMNVELITLDPKPSAVSEAFRSTLVSILSRPRMKRNPKLSSWPVLAPPKANLPWPVT